MTINLKKYFLSSFLVLQIFLYKILQHYPALVEKHYSLKWVDNQGFYFREFFGQFGFSVGDFIYGILILWILKWLIVSRKLWTVDWKNQLLLVINFLSIVYFLFHICWGLNYYRLPLSQKMNIKTDYTLQDLERSTANLILETNKIHFEITKSVANKVVVTYSENQILQQGVLGYDKLSKMHPEFTQKNLSVKSSLFSKPLSYMGFGGYLNPFTIEAQVNIEIPKYCQPMTVSHEMAHQIGYANESECNFVGFLAANASPDLYCQYSANCFALRYCLSVLKKENSAVLNALKLEINTGILKNFDESDTFWKQHESFIETGFKVFYDQFLKSNNQKDGLNSYGKFLNLLINYQKQSAARKSKPVD